MFYYQKTYNHQFNVHIVLFKKLDDVASQQSHWEHDILILRQQLQTSASRDMQYGLGQSAETLNIESGIRFYKVYLSLCKFDPSQWLAINANPVIWILLVLG